MFKGIKRATIGAFGLAGIQAATVKQVADAKELIAIREAEKAALIKRAENFEAIASTFRDEAQDKQDEANKASRYVKKLEALLA